MWANTRDSLPSLAPSLPPSLSPFLLTEVIIEAQTMNSSALQNVTIKTNNHQVNVTCHFRNDSSPSSQCVIVIRKSTEVILMIEIYTISTNFPVMLNISEPGSYSVAVFGWSDGVIEPFPADLQQVDIIGTSQGNHYCICCSLYQVYIAGRMFFCFLSMNWKYFGCRYQAYINTSSFKNAISYQ